MLKKLLAVALMSLSMLSTAWASVDVNTADHAGLETLSGIGPKRSKAIIEERTKNGPYKDAADFRSRVSGIGDKTLAKLENEVRCARAGTGSRQEGRQGRQEEVSVRIALPRTPRPERGVLPCGAGLRVCITMIRFPFPTHHGLSHH